MRFAPRAKLRGLCLVAAFGRGGPAGRSCSAGALRDVLAHALRDAFHGVLADGTLHNVLAHALRDALHGVLADGALHSVFAYALRGVALDGVLASNGCMAGYAFQDLRSGEHEARFCSALPFHECGSTGKVVCARARPARAHATQRSPEVPLPQGRIARSSPTKPRNPFC